jgi:hypothetical protein
MDDIFDETTPQAIAPSDMRPKATVLVPLYVYPLDDETWRPLYEAYVWPDSTPSLSVPKPGIRSPAFSHIIKPTTHT